MMPQLCGRRLMTLRGKAPAQSVIAVDELVVFLERGLAVDHSTLNRWVLAYAPLIERWLRAFHKPHIQPAPSTQGNANFATGPSAAA
jgi:hypothetical protein